MIAPETASLGILARWYAEPLSHEEAKGLLILANHREQERLKTGGRAYLSPLLKLIALHWQGEPTEGYYEYLVAKPDASIHVEILKPLIYGQLLMSKKTAGAMVHLDQAFHQARLLLGPKDYFILVKRHQTLKNIPLSGPAKEGESLEALLKTGSVIGRLEQGQAGRPGFWHDPNDTYG